MGRTGKSNGEVPVRSPSFIGVFFVLGFKRFFCFQAGKIESKHVVVHALLVTKCPVGKHFLKEARGLATAPLLLLRWKASLAILLCKRPEVLADFRIRTAVQSLRVRPYPDLHPRLQGELPSARSAWNTSVWCSLLVAGQQQTGASSVFRF